MISFQYLTRKEKILLTVNMMIEWIEIFVQNVSFESVLDVKELNLNYLKKHGLVEENVVLI